MTTKEIQKLMGIVRPAIIALYGRQPLKLESYKIGLIYANSTRQHELVISGKDARYRVELVDSREKIPQVTLVDKVTKSEGAEIERLQEALQEMMVYNPLRNDRDAYLLATAEWGLDGKWGVDKEFSRRPQPGDFGLE